MSSFMLTCKCLNYIIVNKIIKESTRFEVYMSRLDGIYVISLLLWLNVHLNHTTSKISACVTLKLNMASKKLQLGILVINIIKHNVGTYTDHQKLSVALDNFEKGHEWV